MEYLEKLIDFVFNVIDIVIWTLVAIIVVISYAFVFVAVAAIYACMAIMQFFDLVLYNEPMTIIDDVKDFIIALKEMFRYLKTLSVDEN